MVGQRIDHDLLVSIFEGLTERLLQEEDKEQAAADWQFIFSELEPLFSKLNAAFPVKKKKAG